MRKKKSKKSFEAFCECGHDHVKVTGDNGKYHDELRFELLPECCYCSCEKYKPMKKEKK